MTVIGAICEMGVIDLTLPKPKAAQKRIASSKKRKRADSKAAETEAKTESVHVVSILWSS